MGLTPMEGLMMATRSGTVDPGLLLHLLREGWTPEELASVLEERSGLHGLSGISASAQEVAEAAEGGDDSARLALGAYVHRVRAAVGAAAATLGGLDVLAFAGGVGEGAPVVRARVCDGLAHLGVELDVDRNEATTEGTVDVGVGAARVVVVDSDEELAVAREVRGTLSR